MLSTVQDSGRPGYESSGIPWSGAFDNFSYRVGNFLVGNEVGCQFFSRGPIGDAGLEVTLLGAKFKALANTVVAVTGADMATTINGKPLPVWEAVEVEKDDVLEFKTPRFGARAYIAMAGGIDVPLFLGSRSTYVGMGGKVGGYEGRALKKGDILRSSTPRRPLNELAGRRFRSDFIPAHVRNPVTRWEIGVIMGPQDYLIEDKSVEDFLKSDWKVAPAADRGGYRYRGPQLLFKPRPDYLVKAAGFDPSNIVCDANAIPGSIQVPGGLEAILLAVDGPTMGGFAKIATVAVANVSMVAQTKTGDITRWVPISTEEAAKISDENEKKLHEHNIQRT